MKTMQERYEELCRKDDLSEQGEGPEWTDDERTESIFLFYKIEPGATDHWGLGQTPENVHGLTWCAACGKAHTPPVHEEVK